MLSVREAPGLGGDPALKPWNCGGHHFHSYEHRAQDACHVPAGGTVVTDFSAEDAHVKLKLPQLVRSRLTGC
jgi:hypothetical protein